MREKRCCQYKKGVTLLELLIAMAIFVGVVTALFMTFLTCMFLGQVNSSLVIAAGDAQYLLEEMKALAYSDITSAYLSANYPSTYFSNLDNESISFDVDTVGGVREVTVIVDWDDEQGRSREFRLSTRFTS